MAKRNYDFNFKTMTLTITKAFEEAMKDPFSTEYKILKQFKKDYPMVQVVEKKTSHKGKGLTYENMKNYILSYSNSDEILPMFYKAIDLSVVQANKYGFVKKWFLNQFPNYKEMPDFDENGEIYVIPFMPKAEAIMEINNFAVDWDCSFEEALRGIVMNDFVCAGFREEQVEAEFGSMNEEELLNVFFGMVNAQ